MFRNNIAFKGICTIILCIIMGISQASYPVELRITNPTPGIDACSDPAFANKTTCEDATGALIWTDAGETWNGATCSDPIFDNQDSCVEAGTCSSPNFTTQATCEAGTPYWTTFTLDIVMTNQAGCAYCDDPLYNTETLCESVGSGGGDDGVGVWTFDTSINDPLTCAGECVGNGTIYRFP